MTIKITPTPVEDDGRPQVFDYEIITNLSTINAKGRALVTPFMVAIVDDNDNIIAQAPFQSLVSFRAKEVTEAQSDIYAY